MSPAIVIDVSLCSSRPPRAFSGDVNVFRLTRGWDGPLKSAAGQQQSVRPHLATEADMNKPLRKFLGVMGIGLSWSVAWGGVFATLGLIAGMVRPEDIDPGEGPIVIIGTGLLVGFVSGAVFGIILSFAENGKAILDLALIRVAIWGMLAAAVWPLLTAVHDSMMIILCPLGAVCTSAAVAIARRAELHDPERSQLMRLIGRLLASPLQAACASNG
jgi:hypothetical protein